MFFLLPTPPTSFLLFFWIFLSSFQLITSTHTHTVSNWTGNIGNEESQSESMAFRNTSNKVYKTLPSLSLSPWLYRGGGGGGMDGSSGVATPVDHGTPNRRDVYTFLFPDKEPEPVGVVVFDPWRAARFQCAVRRFASSFEKNIWIDLLHCRPSGIFLFHTALTHTVWMCVCVCAACVFLFL